MAEDLRVARELQGWRPSSLTKVDGPAAGPHTTRARNDVPKVPQRQLIPPHPQSTMRSVPQARVRSSLRPVSAPSTPMFGHYYGQQQQPWRVSGIRDCRPTKTGGFGRGCNCEPVEQVVKEVLVPVDRPVRIKVPVYIERRVEVPRYVEVPVQVPVPVERIVEKVVQVPVEVIKEVEVCKEVPVEKVVEVEVIKEVLVEVTKEVTREVIKEVPVEVIKEVEKVVEVPAEVPTADPPADPPAEMSPTEVPISPPSQQRSHGPPRRRRSPRRSRPRMVEVVHEPPITYSYRPESRPTRTRPMLVCGPLYALPIREVTHGRSSVPASPTLPLGEYGHRRLVPDYSHVGAPPWMEPRRAGPPRSSPIAPEGEALLMPDAYPQSQYAEALRHWRTVDPRPCDSLTRIAGCVP